jgi:hypothetical protein
MTKIVAALGITLLTALPAFGQTNGASDSFIRAHIQEIASGNPGAIADDYRPDAFLWWVGGPLDGVYRGAAIGATWKAFAASQGALEPTISSIVGASNPAGQTFVADVTYKGKSATLRVREVFLVRNGKLQDEIWQIAPQGPVVSS